MSEAKNYSSVKVWSYCMTIALSSLYYGYNIGCFNASMDTIAGALHWEAGEKTRNQAMFTAAVPFGAILTTMFAGQAMESYGRRKTLMVAAFAAILVHCFSVIPNTWTFGLSRLFAGMLSGFMTVVPPGFINEILITFGIVIPGVFALPLPTSDYANSEKKDIWMFIFGFPALVMALQLGLFCCVARHESPSWLSKKGRFEEAKAFYQYIYTPDGAEKAFESLQATASLNKELHKGDSEINTQPETEFSIRALFTHRKFRKMLHLCIMLQLMQQWSGVNAIFSYSATMFIFGVFESRVFSLVISIVNFVATCCSIPFVDRMGRRPLLIVGTLGCAISLAATGVTSLMLQPYASMAFVIIFIIFFEQSLGPVVWIFCGEVLYDGAMSVSVMANWICCFVLLLIFTSLVKAFTLSAVFFIFAFVCAIGVICFWIFVFETKGRTKEENQRKCKGET